MQAKQTVILDRDLLDTFPDSEAVNAALHGLKELALRSKEVATAKKPVRSKG